MKRRHRVDDNHYEVIRAFKQMGAGVLDIHNLDSCCDIIVMFRGHTIFVEIKDGSKALSARKLSEGEQKFKKACEYQRVRWALVESLTDVTVLLTPF